MTPVSLVGGALCAVIAPPDSLRLRRAEHLVALVAAGYLVTKFAKVGPRRAYKKVVGILLGGLITIPGVGDLVDGALAGELEDIEREMHGDGDPDAHTRIPSPAIPVAEVLAKAREQKDRQTGFAAGKKWGGIYHEEGALTQLQADMWALFNSSNTLYPEVFPGTRKFEAELVAMTLDMLHGGPSGAVGLLSSGGTESILLAVLVCPFCILAFV